MSRRLGFRPVPRWGSLLYLPKSPVEGCLLFLVPLPTLAPFILIIFISHIP